MGTNKSGWCLGSYPANKIHHDKCPVNFTTNSCDCTACGHPGEKPRGWNNGHLVKGISDKTAVALVPEKLGPVGAEVLDKPTQSVYTKKVEPRKSSAGATEALKALYT